MLNGFQKQGKAMPANKRPRKAYRPKPVLRNVIRGAILGATALTEAERQTIIGPSLKHIADIPTRGLTGGAYIDLVTSLHAAMAIEASGIVRGLKAEFEAAISLLHDLHGQCQRGQNWKCLRLGAGEVETLKNAVELHDFQLQQLSANEFHAIVRKLVNQTMDKENKRKKQLAPTV